VNSWYEPGYPERFVAAIQSGVNLLEMEKLTLDDMPSCSNCQQDESCVIPSSKDIEGEDEEDFVSYPPSSFVKPKKKTDKKIFEKKAPSNPKRNRDMIKKMLAEEDLP